jgi:hypothetical protein
LLELRLTRRRERREKALRAVAGGGERAKADPELQLLLEKVLQDFDTEETAAREHHHATQEAVHARVLAVVTPPAECLSERTVVQSETELRQQFNTEASTLESLKHNEKARLEETLQKRLQLRQKKKRFHHQQQALHEQEALLKKETLAEQQKYDHDGNQKAQLVRLDSTQEMVTLEDIVLQLEEEVEKLESILTQQSLRQNARLEERLLHRRQARQRQLKQAKVGEKDIKREAKKLDKMDESAWVKADQEREAVNRELLQTFRMAAEALGVLTARAFKTLLEETRGGSLPGTNAVAGLEGGGDESAALVGEEEIGSLRSERNAQQRRVDERRQSRLPKRQLSLAVQQSQSDAARLTSGPIRDSWNGSIEEETDPDILDIKHQIANLNRKLQVKREEHLERERAQKRMGDSSHAESLVAISAFTTLKEELCVDVQRKLQRLARQNSSDLPRLVDDESMLVNDVGDAALLPGMVMSDVATETVVPIHSRPMEPPKTFCNVLKMLVRFEQYNFSEDECLVLEEFTRMARKNVRKKSSQNEA